VHTTGACIALKAFWPNHVENSTKWREAHSDVFRHDLAETTHFVKDVLN